MTKEKWFDPAAADRAVEFILTFITPTLTDKQETLIRRCFGWKQA